ncbi:MAG: DUF4197 domain-containing protein [Hyphomonadaceae bacterium]
MRARGAALVVLVVGLGAANAAYAQDLGKILSDVFGKPGASGKGSALSNADVATGLKEALANAGSYATGKLSLKDGFWGDSAVRIPLPGLLGEAQKRLKPLGLSGSLDDLQLRVNRAAEAAMPQAGKLVGDAVTSITFEDALAILRGDTAATDYLRAKIHAAPAAAPVGAGPRNHLSTYFSEALAGLARSTPWTAPKRYGAGLVRTDPKTMLTDAAMTGALNGLFYYVAREVRRPDRSRSGPATSCVKCSEASRAGCVVFGLI